jgi:Na+-driven multidrug efflux pump
MTIHLSEHLTFKKIFLASYAPILMMIFSSLYSIIDGIFVSNFAGAEAFSGVNLVFPFIMILGAVGFMFGAGGSALVSKTLGEGKEEEANRYFSLFVYFVIILGAIGGVAGFFCVEPFVKWMASLSKEATSETMIADATLYGRILCGGIMLMMLQYLFQAFFLTIEKPRLGFIVIVGAGLTNMVLDALFIGVFKWGVAGAAAATLIGQGFSSVFPLIYFWKNKSNKLRLSAPSNNFKALGQAAWNGSSEFVSNISSSIVGMCYNAQLLIFIGEDGVAAYGIIMYMSYVFMAIFIGYATAMAPFIGFQYGAGNKKELSSILKRSFILIAIAGVVMFGLGEALAVPLSGLLSGHSDHIKEVAITANRIYSFVYLTAGFTIFMSSYFTSLNNGTVSAIISFCRSASELLFVFIVPLWLAVNGIWASACFAEIISSATMLFFLFFMRKRYGY